MQLINKCCYLLVLLSILLIETYGQRSRSYTSSNQEFKEPSSTSTRSRGRTRFIQTEEFSEATASLSPHQRDAGTRIRSSSIKPRVDKTRINNARPTHIPPRTYAVEENLEDSSFSRRTNNDNNKPSVINDHRFEVPIIDTKSPKESIINLPLNELGFGSTARAILHARGETLPPKTTTPLVDEQYLLNNFGTTLRSLAAAHQRPSSLRNELSTYSSSRRRVVESIPAVEVFTSSRQNGRSRNGNNNRNSVKKLDRKISTEAAVIEEFIATETPLAAESVQGLNEQPEGFTDESLLASFDGVNTEIPIQEQQEQIIDQITTAKTISSVPSSVSNRRGSTRGRSNFKSRIVEEPEVVVTQSSRSRTPRTRPTRRSEIKSVNRRYEDVSVAETVVNNNAPISSRGGSQSRERTGRKIEKVPSEGSTTTTISSNRNVGRKPISEYSTERSFKERTRPPYVNMRRAKNVEYTTTQSLNHNNIEGYKNEPISRRRNGGNNRFATSTEKNTFKPRNKLSEDSNILTTASSPSSSFLRNRFKHKSNNEVIPINIDESKLEVLPLFENEPKQVISTKSRGFRSRSDFNRHQSTAVLDYMQISATENNNIKSVEKPSTTTVALNRPTSYKIANLSTTSTTTKKPLITKSLPVIKKESVVSQVNEVISTSSITRRKKIPKSKAAEILSSRGTKKADIKDVDNVKRTKNSSDEVAEEDNYPASFKALIQAKNKKNKEIKPSVDSTLKNSSKTSSNNNLPRSTSAVRAIPKRSSKIVLINETINYSNNDLASKLRVSSLSTTSSPIFINNNPRTRQLPRFSEKPKTTISTTKNNEKIATTTKKPSQFTRTYSDYPSRSRKTLRSTASPPSTTPLSVSGVAEFKYSAKFVNNNEQDNQSSSNKSLKGIYSSKKVNAASSNEEKPSIDGSSSSVQDGKLTIRPIKKFNNNRYSSKYRGENSARSSVLKASTNVPFYTPTIPTPAYVPTVPSLLPSGSRVDGILAVKDKDLGVEVISFDEPSYSNSIPSADLVNGEFLATDRNLKLSPMVKDGTTEKPVSIIERIINSITMISTTVAPNTTAASSFSTTEGPKNSAILKLATKKTDKPKQPKDIQTNIIETITSEKPTTIIEKIRSSLTAIQTNEVGTSSTSELNTILNSSSSSSSSTTPLSIIVTKYSSKYRDNNSAVAPIYLLPAPQALSTSTSASPLATIIEPNNNNINVDNNRINEKKTIGKLLDILNGLVSTASNGKTGKIVVVTPKNMPINSSSKSGFISSTFAPQEPIEAIDSTAFLPPKISSTANIILEDTETTTFSVVSTVATTMENPTTEILSTSETTTEIPTSSTFSDALLASSTETTTAEIPISTFSDALVSSSTEATFYTNPPTTTTYNISTFQVSPESVSIFSANDLPNFVISDDVNNYSLINTVQIPNRMNNNNNIVLTPITTTEITTTLESSTTTNSDNSSTVTTDLTSTFVPLLEETTTILTSSLSNNISSTTSSVNISANSERSGKLLLSDVGEPVNNNIDVASTSSTTTSSITPDYFVFAILNNNTILRKRPPPVPNKDTPFIIVGLYPNNTVVRKYPNGTLVPMEPILKVRGFDIRPNPPELVEITDNQVVTETKNGLSTSLDNNSVNTVFTPCLKNRKQKRCFVEGRIMQQKKLASE